MANEAERKPWDQLEGEPSEAYARFLIYCTMGRTRSLEAAYLLDSGQTAKKSKKKQSISGQWTNDSTKFNWIERAIAWDIEKLTIHGEEVVLDFIGAMRNYANKTLHASLGKRLTPRDWNQLTNALNTLGKFIPADTVESISDTAQEGENPAIGNSGSGD